MPINRAPFNALIDDAGTGLTGSIWNKAAIQSVLLDPTDAYVGGTWTDVAHSALAFSASTGTWTVPAAALTLCRYMVIGGKTVVFLLDIAGSTQSISATPTVLNFVVPAAVPKPNAGMSSPLIYGVGAAVGTGLNQLASGNATFSFLRDIAGTPWPTLSSAAAYFRGCFVYSIN